MANNTINLTGEQALGFARRLDRIETVVSSWDKRLKEIAYNQRYYLRTRGKVQLKAHKQRRQIIAYAEQLKALLGQARLHVTRRKDGKKLNVPLLTPYESVKLRRLLERRSIALSGGSPS